MTVSTEQAQGKPAAPVLTEEMAEGFAKNPGTLSQAPKEIRAAMRERIGNPPADDAAGETGADPKPGDKPAETPANTETPAAGEKPAGEKPAEEAAPKGETADEKRARLRAMDNESNTIEQRLAAANRRLAKAKAAEDEFKKANPEKKPNDYLEDSHQEDLHKTVRELTAKVAGLQAQLEDQDRDEIETLTRSKATKAEDRLSTEIDLLMEDPKFAAARMKKSFAQANQEYANWLDNLVQVSGITQDTLSEEDKKNPVQSLRRLALAKYQEDAAFKASVKISPPEEMDKLSFLLEAYGRKAQNGGTIKGHLFEILDEAGVLEQGFQRGRQDAARTAANKTADAIRQQNDEVTTIAPTDGSSRPAGSNDELTPQSAAAFMQLVKTKQANREKLSDAERKKLVLVREYVANGMK